MAKKYENPMLLIVSIKNNDIVTGSTPKLGGDYSGQSILAPGQRGLDDWYEGY